MSCVSIYFFREDLRKVKGVGAAAFRQCAGFVRIFDESRDEPLDALMVHTWVAIQLAKIWLDFWLEKRLEIPF